MNSLIQPEFNITRREERCSQCLICIKQCAHGAHINKGGRVASHDSKCVNCQRCVVYCRERALAVQAAPPAFRENHNWTSEIVRGIQSQAEQRGILLTGMGSPRPLPVYWDKMLLNASQVTNPSIDPLREPMELKTFLGQKPTKAPSAGGGPMPPQLELDVPIMFAAMSFGAVSLNTLSSLARAAADSGTYFNTGEGGFPEELMPYTKRAIVQVASGRFSVHPRYLQQAAAIEIKIGQGAKPGIGGHLPGEKVGAAVSRTRMIPEGSDAISPAPHHDIYSIEDLKQLIYALKEATDYEKPIFVKVAAVHNIAAIASGIVRAGADAIVIDGFRGGTGATPVRIRDHIGIPVEFALAVVDARLREEKIRQQVSLIAAGSLRHSADVVKALALGADAVYVGTAALVALGCHLCQACYTGRCSWGIATQDSALEKRLDPEEGSRRAANLIFSWQHEIKEMMGAMGINAVESLRGNRLMLRGIGCTEGELAALGIGGIGQ
jgi:glutamate synthase domain-containing protein 2